MVDEYELSTIRLKLVRIFAYNLDDGREYESETATENPLGLGSRKQTKRGWTTKEFVEALSEIEKYVVGA